MKFLIIRFSSIGDIVLTTPVIRNLKTQIATAEVHYLTKKSFSSILSSNPYIDKLHLMDDDLDQVTENLKQEDFDYVIDLHHNIRTLKVKKALNKKTFSFNKLNIEKWLYVNFKWNVMPDLHIVDRYMKTLKSFGVENDEKGLDYFIPENEHVKEEDIPTTHLAGYVALVIGGAHGTKKYPVHKWKEFCEKFQHPVMLLGGKEDQAQGEVISALDTFKIYNACGKFSINESADLVRRSKMIVTNDTGLMHVAAAFNKPVISLWGNTVPEFGMYPYYGNKDVVNSEFEIRKLSCRPCSKIGYAKCPLGHFKCMELISANAVSDKATDFLK
ncbi:MAG TPA: glycosyltransferase family 9 protein [Chitinophagaceae bacterium]|nr:glycosyltransferase family 9 protein [Chitinophagaceae bacterium]